MGNRLVEVLQKDRLPLSLVESRPPQMAEQLMEVPTIVSFFSLQQPTVEQIVDIPVPGRGGELGGLRGLQSSNSVFWSRSPSLPIQVEVFKIFSQARVPQRLLRFSPGHAGEGFFF